MTLLNEKALPSPNYRVVKLLIVSSWHKISHHKASGSTDACGHMVQPNLNWSLQHPVTYFMDGTGTEHLSAQMDEKRTGQSDFITAHLASMENSLLQTHMLNQKESYIVTQIESEFISTLLFSWHVFQPVCVCVRACPCLCESSIRKCHTPQALDVSSRPPHLHDHVSLPVGEKDVPQQKGGGKKMGLYVTCFSQLKSPVQSGSEVLNLRAFGCFTNMVSRMMLLISVYFFKEKRGMLVAGKG